MSRAARSRGPVDPRLLVLARGALGGVVGLVAVGVARAAGTVAAALAAASVVTALVTGPGVVPRGAIAVLAGVVVARAALAWLEPWLAARTGERVVERERERLLEQLGHDDDPAIVPLAGHGVDALRAWFTGTLPALVLAVVLPPAVLVVLALADPTSALVVAATLPLVPVFAVLLGWAARARARREWAAGERLAGHFLDTVTGLATLRLFGRSRRAVEAVAELGERHRVASTRVLRVAFLSSTALELLGTLSVGLVAVGAGVRLVEGTMALHPALVAILLAGEAHRPLREAGARFHEDARATAVLDERDAVLAGAASASLVRSVVPGPARVRVRGLEVRHPGRWAATPSLPALDAEGGVLAVVAGPSGAGKTTLLRALAGTLDDAASSAGTVEVQGRVVVLGQHPQLPHAATVREALGEGSAEGSAEGPADLLRRLGLGLDLDAPLAEGGRSLSSGQRRRLALARVLGEASADPAGAVVLLDEPTAHLDADAERAVVTELRALARRGALVLAVAHRPALRDAADRVVELGARAGSGAANGRFAASTRTNGAFAASTGAPPQAANGDFGRLEAANSAFAATPASPADRRGLPLAVLLGAGAAVAGVALTASAAWLIARAAAQPPILTLSIAVVAVRGFAIARPVLRHLERVTAHADGLARMVRWRRRVVAALAERVPGAVAGRRGHLLARVTDDVDVRLDGLVRGVLPLAAAALALPLLLGVAILASTAVALALLPGLAVAALGAPLLAAVAARRTAPALERGVDDLRAAVVETHAARDELAARGPEALRARPRAATAALARARRREARGGALAGALAQLGLGAASVAAAMAAPASTSPELAAVAVLAPLALGETVLALPAAAAAVVRGRRARARLAGLEAPAPPAREPEHPVSAPGVGDLHLRGVTAGWGARPALRDLDLDLPAGHRLGVTGASGSGKSTLAAVLLRLLDPRAGTVTLGGVDAAAVPGDVWRRRVALVGEHDHVFATTLREDLRFAAPGATDAELVAVLRRVRLGAWFDGLPDGLDTWLDAGSVSGGERRRLAAARALLVDPAVLVLDEPTEGLDPATARALVADLLDAAGETQRSGARPSSSGRTVVLLAHRGEGLDLVDEVRHLEHGALRARETERSGARPVSPEVQAKSPAA
ncbi:thiol reductant ABC exporter subunit CydC [Actinomycetospora lemnae]|uniref:Thiol reductant ABC exporter subunit CydC n=1 Tax=Actinomycetospora lemnae TaxID=3019891 RepID=A0ABT5SYZ1_9PSEU|nr:thiol reductant ABC exporter subunit CydC [Actinomycetospora sp. DW7H6]MDD7967655.1 thiol reductant ABC exporter subunit CydC [Actinomycetospora sp. DW7H6]